MTDSNKFVPAYATLKTIVNAIAKNKAAHEKVDNEWQAIAMSVLAHIDQHRDVSVVNNLVNSMYAGLGKGARHVAMTSWILKYLPVIANINPQTKATQPFVYSKARAKEAVDYTAAMQEPWYSMKPSKAPDQVIDLRTLLKAVISKAVATTKEGSETMLIGNYEQIKALADMAGLHPSDIPAPEMFKFAASKADAKAAKELEAAE